MALRAALLLFVAACSSTPAPVETRRPAPPLLALPDHAEELRRDFDAADDRTRYIFAFSPT